MIEKTKRIMFIIANTIFTGIADTDINLIKYKLNSNVSAIFNILENITIAMLFEIYFGLLILLLKK